MGVAVKFGLSSDAGSISPGKRQQQHNKSGKSCQTHQAPSSYCMSNNRDTDSVVASGVLFLGAVLSGTTAGDILANVVLRPSDFPDSLFGRRATTWERYTVLDARVRYSPSIPTSINCNLITYHETDVYDEPVSQPEVLNIALAHRGAVQHAANRLQFIKCNPPKDELWTSKGTTDRNDAFGKIVVVQRQNPVDFSGNTLPPGTPLGDLVLEWRVRFSTANLEPTPVVIKEVPTQLVPKEYNGTAFTNVLEAGEYAFILGVDIVDPTIDVQIANGVDDFWRWDAGAGQVISSVIEGPVTLDVSSSNVTDISLIVMEVPSVDSTC